MYQINNEKFGQFLSEIRKEKSMTQKELADKLFVSDKTVSKWKEGTVCLMLHCSFLSLMCLG